MPQFSNYLRNKLAAHSVGQAAYTMPVGTYAGLFLTYPGPDGGVEVSTSGTNYARQAITWGTPANGNAANTAEIRFPVSGTATTRWGRVRGLGIFDASAGGNLLYWTRLDPVKLVSNTGTGSINVLTVAIGECIVDIYD